jgi:hypothetical protein
MSRLSLRRPLAASFALALALLAAASTTESRPAAAKAAPSKLAFKATVLPKAGGEPNVSVSPNGRTILVSGLGDESPAALWRSMDGGKTFAHLKPTFPGSTGGGDWDMRWLDNHTVVAADLGDGIYVHRSEDGGLHWTSTAIRTDFYDRPWLGVGGESVYVVAKGADQLPYCYVSDDGGRTFDPIPIPLYGTGTLPAELGGQSPTAAEALLATNTYIDHVATDPETGQLYVLYGLSSLPGYGPASPLGNPNRLYVARLEDGPAGPQFSSHAVHLGTPADQFIDGFNWLTVDRTGTVYALANGLHDGRHSLWLTYSKDHGDTWSALVDLGQPGAANVFGSIAAGAPGTLSMVYLRGSLADPALSQNWYVEMARVTAANTPRPRVQRTRPVTKAIHTKDICFYGILCGFPGFGNNRDLLDYIWNAVGPDGKAFAVVASDGPATGGGTDVNVIVLRQTAGPAHGRGIPS